MSTSMPVSAAHPVLSDLREPAGIDLEEQFPAISWLFGAAVLIAFFVHVFAFAEKANRSPLEVASMLQMLYINSTLAEVERPIAQRFCSSVCSPGDSCRLISEGTGWAGFCRNTDLWGPCYAGMTSDSNDAVKNYNPRMPALLHADEWDHWLTCSVQDVVRLQLRTYPADALEITRTDEPWVPRHAAPMREPEPQLL